MISKLKKYAPHLGCVALGAGLGLALATTTIGAAAVSKLAALRGKAGI